VTAGPRELRRVAEAADRLGFHHLSCSEHVAIPASVAATRGARYYDPAATLGFFAACTEQIRLLTHVVVLPYHHPLAVAKRFGTLDRLSGGSVILGVGVGSLQEEFCLLGADFAGRGARFEEALVALRAALGSERPDHRGVHYSFSDLILDPTPVQSHVPIWLGGRSPRSLRRALRYADGWDPFRYGAAELEALLQQARDWPEWRQRRTSFALALTPARPFDLSTEIGIAAAAGAVAQFESIGATILNLRFRSRDAGDYIDQLERFAARIAPRFA
jgi:probable F420-dependent oxidoreductase